MHSTQTTKWHATVAVRVPRDGTQNLASAAAVRLATRDPIDDVDVTSVRGLEPALAATVVTLEATVSTTSGVDTAQLRQKLEAAPGCQRVDGITRA